MPAEGFLLAFIIPTAIVASFVFFLMSVFSQESKQFSRTEIVWSAFISVVSAVALSMIVASTMYLGQEALRAWVFRTAQPPGYAAPPPMLSLSVSYPKEPSPVATAYTCTDTCQFTEAERQQVAQWRADYQNWRTDNQSGFSTERKRGIVNALSFLLVGAVLFAVFFVWLGQRDEKRFQAVLGKPTSLRTVYFYLIALVGLVGVVLTSAFLINLGLKTALNLENTTAVPRSPVMLSSYDTVGVQSVINCTEKCDFSKEDQALARTWLDEYKTWQEQNSYPRVSSAQSTLATQIPILLISLLVFLYHFFTIRRESRSGISPAPPL